MKPHKISPKTIVRITWEDSCASAQAWTYGDELQDTEPVVIESVGFVVATGKRGISITTAFSTFRDNPAKIRGASQPFIIPWGCICKLKTIKRL